MTRWILLPLLLLVAACNRSVPVQLAADVDDALARPLLNEFAEHEKATIDRVRAADAEVLWAGDPQDVLERAAAGELAPLSPAVLGERKPPLVDPEHHWVAAAAIGRVIVYDPERLPDDTSPTHVLDLARPEFARQLVMADPTHGTGLWHAAALCAKLGDEAGLGLFRYLRANGARVVASEDAVVTALTAGEQPLALIDSDRAYAAQAALPRLVITIPDQGDEGMGVFVLPSVVAITPRGARNARAVELAEFLLAPPQAFRIALTTNAFVISADGKAPPSLLNVDRMKLMAISYGELVKKLAAIRAALSGAPA